ncbi:MAG: hypothetical protein ABW352_22745 [Polyangiales bacterium]
MTRFLDDYLQTLMVDGRFPVTRHPLNLYDFVSDDNRALFRERGLLPWWTHPQLTMRFLRPVSSLLLWAELRLLHLDVALQHVHSFLWWSAAVFAARGLYLRVLPRRTAWLALVIFALAPCHVMPLGWIANRNALVCLVFGLLALRSHREFCEQPRLRTALWTCLGYTLALLSGELALCFLGYMLALSLLRARTLRVLGLLPVVLPTAGYLLTRHVLGYGSSGSGFYVDPLHAPWAFLRVAPFRLSALFVQTWLSVSTETWWASLPWAMVLPCALLGALFLFPQLRRAHSALDTSVRSEARWLLVGSLLSLLPVLPTVPAARLTAVALLGAAAWIALVLEHAWFAAPEVPPTRAAEWAGLGALMLAFLHLVHSPVSAWLASMSVHGDAERFRDDVHAISERMQELETREVVVLRGGVDSFFCPFATVVEGGPWSRWDILSDPNHMLTLRPEDDTLELVTPRETGLFPTGGLSLFRGVSPPAPADVTVSLAPFSLEVLESADTIATRARITFHRPLLDGRLWLSRRHGHLNELTLPELGFGLPSDP